MKLRVLIVDDEAPARERLASLLAAMDDVVTVGEASNGDEALELASDLAPDVILLDVRMPGMDGIEAARQLAALAEPPAVIFTTAFDEYAVNAFEAQATGYLLKPIRAEKLAAAITQCLRLTRPQRASAEVAARFTTKRAHLPVKQRDGIKLVPIADVRCFLADQKYTTVRHTGGDDLIEESLRMLEEEFGAVFVRIHRSALVNTDHLERIERDPDGQYFVRLRGMDERLAVSRRMAGDLRDRFRL